MENWQNDKAVQKWFKQVGKERTIKNYKREFPQFLEFVNVEPSEIIQQRLEQLATTDNQKRHYWDRDWIWLQR